MNEYFVGILRIRLIYFASSEITQPTRIVPIIYDKRNCLYKYYIPINHRTIFGNNFKKLIFYKTNTYNNSSRSAVFDRRIIEHKILTLTHWYDFPVCIPIAAVGNTSKPLRQFFRRNPFEIWALAELDSQTAKRLLNSSWPVIAVDAVVWNQERINW